MTGIQDKNYYDNVEQDFVPDGAPVTEVWDEIANSACNTCHNPLAAHGGSRQDVKLCVLCHSPADGRSRLPATPWTSRSWSTRSTWARTCRASQAGIPYYVRPQREHRLLRGRLPAGHPQLHHAATPRRPRRPTIWYTYPSQVACGACHDNIDWVDRREPPGRSRSRRHRVRQLPPAGRRPRVGRLGPGRAHGALQVDPAQGPERRDRLGDQHGPRPEADGRSRSSSMTRTDGPVLPSTTPSGSSNLNLLMGGPTTDYAINPLPRARGRGRLRRDDRHLHVHDRHPGGRHGHLGLLDRGPPHRQPRSAPQRRDDLHRGRDEPGALRGRRRQARRSRGARSSISPTATRATDSSPSTAASASTPKSASCATTPTRATSPAGRPTPAPPESIDFKRMIHRIHTGEELTQIYTIYGFGTSPANNFNHVLYPGDRRDCVKCHVDGHPAGQREPAPGPASPRRRCATGTPRSSTTRQPASVATTRRPRPPTPTS